MRRCWDWKKFLSLVRVSLLLGMGMAVPACGTTNRTTIADPSPPVDLPLPISNLMTLIGPDANGTVKLLGDPGAVLAGASVQVTNLNQGTARNWESYFLASAWAQNAIEVVANPDGSFAVTLTAKVGDTLRIVQRIDNHLSPPVDLVVTGKNLPLSIVPRDLKIGVVPGKAFLVGPEGDQGIVLQLALDPLPGSFPETFFQLPDFSGISHLALAEQSGFGLVISTSDNGLYRLSLNQDSPSLLTEISSPLWVDVLEESERAVIGSDGSPSLALYNIPENKILCSVDPAGPKDPKIQVLRTTQVAALPSIESSMTQFLALSQFSDASWWLSVVQVHNGNCAVEQPVNIALADLTEPGDLTVSGDGTVAWLSDTGGDQVLRVDLKTSGVTAIPVGKGPVGLALNEALTTLWVVNQEDNSITAVQTQDLSTQTLTGVGKGPSRLVVDAEHAHALVLSPSGQWLVLLDLKF